MSARVTRADKQLFIRLLSDGESVTNACQMMGWARSTYYARLKSDKKFSREIKAAQINAANFILSAYKKNIAKGKERTIIHAMDRKDRLLDEVSYTKSLIAAQQKAIAAQDWELAKAIQTQIESERGDHD